MSELRYETIWLTLVDIRPMKGHNFVETIDAEIDDDVSDYIGAIANILVKAEDIFQAINLIKPGLAELHFEPIFIEKIENVAPLVENGDLIEEILEEIEWLLKSDYVFKISGKLFPYSD